MPSKSPAQHRLMEAAAHHAGGFGGVPQSVGEEFVRADRGASDAKPYLAAGLIYVAPDGDMLLLRRSAGEANYAGHWALPGGKAEQGEDAVTAAEREAHEEIGQAPVGDEPVLIDQVNTPNGFSFHTFAKTVERKFAPTLNEEHSGFCWAPLEMLPEPLHPGVKRVLTSVRNHAQAADAAALATAPNSGLPAFKRAEDCNTSFFYPREGALRNGHFFR